MKAIRQKLIAKSNEGLTFVGEYSGGVLTKKMGHLACFSGGLFALTAMQVDSLEESERAEYRRLAEEITNTCHQSYIRSDTHIGPESFYLEGAEAVARNQNEKYYILRPEVVESYFYLWRMTKDNKYREWAWDAVQSIEKYCKTDSGYSGLKNVYDKNTEKDDVQQSFFFAETLKYLYLIFSDDETLPFDKYVFNTEAHPFLIQKS
jgi:mannosyl-oligosaccharide alpha-1,2-mannosidase